MFNGILFQQSLQDLVKGIRAHRRDEEEYIRSKVAEIGDECRGADMTKKTTAVLKLTYLQMMGHSISFASFHIVEVMSSPQFASKRIGYLAAAQSFSPTTDVLLLTTNQFKKDLTTGKLQDCSQALTCLGKLVTEELGRDLEQDVSLLLSSPRPYIRKKALLVLYRLIMVHPETLSAVSDRFRACLSDKDPGVACAAVTVTCELARAAPQSFLSLAPILYQLLTSKDSNNWMLIKIVKLMGVLTPLEPRLGKKLVDPLTTLMRTTRAKSLLYECCSTVTAGLMDYPEAVELCAQRLGEFMDESDQNLKYLGLLSMKKLIQAHPHLALEHRDNIMDCLDDEDIGIRMRALELIAEFVTKRTLRDVSRILLRKLRKSCGDGYAIDDAYTTATSGLMVSDAPSAYSPFADQEAPYREALARQLLRPGEYRRSTDPSKAGYDMLTTGDDFAWYATSILAGLAELSWLSEGVREVIGDQLLELTSRVEALRPVTVKLSEALLLARATKINGPKEESVAAEKSVSEISEGLEEVDGNAESADMVAVSNEKKPEVNIEEKASEDPRTAKLSSSLAGSTAWILGEYAELIQDYTTATKALTTFPPKVLDAASQVRVLTAAMKVFAACSDAESASVRESVLDYVQSLIDNQFAEVQERAWFFKSILSNVSSQERKDLVPLFEGKLIPVDHRAQSRIPVAEDLDLEKPLLDTGSESLLTYLLKAMGTTEDEEETGDDDESLFKEAVFANTTLSFSGGSSVVQSSTEGQSGLLSSLPTKEKEKNPFYLGTESKSTQGTTISPRSDRGEDLNSKYGYHSGLLSSEAAVVIKEDRPFGMHDSDGENQNEGQGSTRVNTRLQAAFKGAFDGSGISRAEKEKDGKKKKKKKKDGKEKKTKGSKKSGANGRQPTAEVSLIDFGDAPAAAPVGGKSGSSDPRHLADSLLM